MQHSRHAKFQVKDVFFFEYGRKCGATKSTLELHPQITSFMSQNVKMVQKKRFFVRLGDSHCRLKQQCSAWIRGLGRSPVPTESGFHEACRCSQGSVCTQGAGRFSKNAAMPSWASAVSQRRDKASIAASTLAGAIAPDKSRSSAFASRTAPGAQDI